jgi:nucleotide-binding universal stress UspA family protein
LPRADHRRNPRVAAKGAHVMKRILLAYDGTDPARRALDMAGDLARRYEVPLSVVSVIPIHAGRAPIDPWDDPDSHAAQLEEARQLLARQGIEAELLDPAGDPAEAIERVAEAGGFDMIVLGSRGLGAVARFLQGSVSEHVATHARATVVIAR